MRSTLFTDLAEQLKISPTRLHAVLTKHLIKRKHYRRSNADDTWLIYPKGVDIIKEALDQQEIEFTPDSSEWPKEVKIVKLPNNKRLVLADVNGVVCRVIVKQKMRRLYRPGNMILINHISDDLYTSII